MKNMDTVFANIETRKAVKKAVKEFSKKYGLHFTIDHNGKMIDMTSLSTSPKKNPGCIARAKDVNSVCYECYSMDMNEYYSGLENALAINYDILTRVVIPVSNWPVLNVPVFRIESFGDVFNTIQVQNYVNFALANPNTNFGIWTKVPFLYDKVFRSIGGKPKNMVMNVSSTCLNKAYPIGKFDWIDHVFTVYTADYVINNNITIHCGGKECRNCGICYTPTSGKPFFVNELLKKEQGIHDKAVRECSKLYYELQLNIAKNQSARFQLENFDDLFADDIEYVDTMKCYKYTYYANSEKLAKLYKGKLKGIVTRTYNRIPVLTERLKVAIEYANKTKCLVAV